MKEAWKKFGLQIISGILIVACSGFSASYFASRAANNEKIKNAAPKEYVDTKITQVITHSDKEDEKLKKEIDKLDDKKVDQTSFDILHKDIIFIKNWIVSKEK